MCCHGHPPLVLPCQPVPLPLRTGNVEVAPSANHSQGQPCGTHPPTTAASAPAAPAPAVHPAPAEPTGAVAGRAPWFSRAPPAQEALPYGDSWFYVPLLLSAAGMLRSDFFAPIWRAAMLDLTRAPPIAMEALICVLEAQPTAAAQDGAALLHVEAVAAPAKRFFLPTVGQCNIDGWKLGS